MVVFEIPERTPSMNLFTGRGHWSRYAKTAKRYKEMVWALTSRAPKATGKRFVRITRRSTRTLDDDNLRGGCKMLLDALKAQGLIIDDSPAWISVDYVQEKSPSKTTLVEVFEEGDPLPAGHDLA